MSKPTTPAQPLRPTPDRRYVSLTQAQVDMDAGLPFLTADDEEVTRSDLRAAGLRKVSVRYDPDRRPAVVVLWVALTGTTTT